MSRDGRKYNVWIAYSDLFTNLSTFLLISALGVFAAMGASDVRDPLLSPPCSTRDVDSLITDEGDGLLKPLRVEEGVLVDPCRRYYEIGDYRFRSSLAHRPEFKNEEGGQLEESTIMRRVCQPIWDTLVDRGFREAKGSIRFEGIASLKSHWRHPQACPERSGGPTIHHRLYDRMLRTAGTPLEVLRRCDAGARDEFCNVVRQCPGEEAAGWPVCREIDLVRTWKRQGQLACMKTPAELQVLTLFEICARAPFDEDHFRDGKILAASHVPGLDLMSKVAELQPRLSYDIISLPPERSRDSRNTVVSPLASQRSGAVLVEVKFDP